MRVSFKRQIYIWFSIILFVFIIINVTSYFAIYTLNSTEENFKNSEKIINQIKKITPTIRDIESSARGYVITGDETFMEYFNPNKKSLREELIVLHELVKGEPGLQSQLERFDSLVKRKAERMTTIYIARKTRGFDSASKITRTGKGFKMMWEISSLADSMIKFETKKYEIIQKKARSQANATKYIIIIGGLANITFILTCLLVINYYINMKEKDEEKITELYKKAELLKNRYDGIIESTTDFISAINCDYEFIAFNKVFRDEFKKVFGADIEIGMTVSKALSGIPDEQEVILKLWSRALSGEQFNIEQKFGDARLQRNMYQVVWNPLMNESGEIIGASNFGKDITAKWLLEEKLKKTNELLESSNQELESFSYSVSHDLRAPLRHIDGYSRMLMRKAADQLDEKNLRYIHIISESANELGNMIDNLLVYSRINRTELKIEQLDLNWMIQDIIQKLMFEDKSREIEWNIEKLPPIKGDRSYFYLIFQNLISNAVKFTRYKEKAIISISCVSENNHYVFCVKDNGAGFDMKYYDKLFGVFQRLHSAEEFEGTGIGLANVKRFITKHGGTIRAESTEGEGAAFYLSLPKG